MPGFGKNPAFIRNFKKSTGIISLAVILLVSTFSTGRAYASVFTLFSIASGKTTNDTAPTIQKMKILEVSFSPILNGRGGQDIITDESALFSNDTPLTADIPPEEKIEEKSDEVVVDHKSEKSAISANKVHLGLKKTKENVTVVDNEKPIAQTFSESSATDISSTENTTSVASNEEDSDTRDEDGIPLIGKLIRTKTNTGDSSDFIRPIAEGVGRKSQDKHDTWAVDIAASVGTPIMATEKGTVILVKSFGYNGGYGKYIAIEHSNGVQTLYAHMSKTIAEVGDIVLQGETIGLVGSTGRSTGPHVHYEVRGALNNCFKTCE